MMPCFVLTFVYNADTTELFREFYVTYRAVIKKVVIIILRIDFNSKLRQLFDIIIIVLGLAAAHS